MPTTITGTDGVSQVQAGSIQSDDLAAGAITIGSGDLPAGSVIQVIQKIYNPSSIVSTTSSSYVSSGFIESITPQSGASKVLARFDFSADQDHRNTTSDLVSAFVVARNGSVVDNNSRASFSSEGIGSNDFRFILRTSISFLDSPNTTSSTEYELFFKADIGTAKIHGFQSIIVTLMEIAG